MDSQTPQAIAEIANEAPGIDDVQACHPNDRRPHPDAELVERFAASNFDSPEFHAWFKNDIFDIVAGQLDGWISSEAVYPILASSKNKRIWLDPSPEERLALRVRHTERADLVADAVNTAGRDFVDKKLRNGKWDPRSGAGVRTYFTRAVLFEFASAFRKWQRRRARDAQRFDKLVREHNSDAGVDILAQLACDDQFKRILDVAQNDQDRMIMGYLLDGLSERDIARNLELRSPKRVRTIKSHMRKAYEELEGGHDA